MFPIGTETPAPIVCESCDVVRYPKDLPLSTSVHTSESRSRMRVQIWRRQGEEAERPRGEEAKRRGSACLRDFATSRLCGDQVCSVPTIRGTAGAPAKRLRSAARLLQTNDAKAST